MLAPRRPPRPPRLPLRRRSQVRNGVKNVARAAQNGARNDARGVQNDVRYAARDAQNDVKSGAAVPPKRKSSSPVESIAAGHASKSVSGARVIFGLERELLRMREWPSIGGLRGFDYKDREREFITHCSRPRSLSFARSHLTDPGPRFGMLANISSVVSRRSPIVFSPANFTAFRIRVGKRTISTRVSSGRSDSRSNILSPIYFALTLSPRSRSRRIWSARSKKAAPSSRTADVHHIAIALGCIGIDKSRYQQPTINGYDFAILFSTSGSGWTDIVFPAWTAL